MKKLFILLSFTLLLSGCGTVIYGTHQDIKIETTPPGSIVRIETQSCITPCTLHITRKAETIYIADGEREVPYELVSSINWGSQIANLIAGGIPGWVFDKKSGGVYTIDDFRMDLQKNRQAEMQKQQ